MSAIWRAAIIQGLVAMAIHPLRTALSTLGIVIGVASLTATLALTDGLQRYVREQVARKTDVQTIAVNSRTVEMRDGFAFPTRGFPIFEHADGSDLQRSLGDAAEVTMVAWGEAVIVSGTAPAHIASVTAALANYLTVTKQDVATGRFFTDGEALHNAPVVVLLHKLAAELSPDGNAARMVD